LDSLNLSTLDTYSLLDGIAANPLMYGFTNVTSPCVTGAIDYVGGTACASTLAGRGLFRPKVRVDLLELSHLSVGSPTEVAVASLPQVQMRDVLESTRRVEPRGEFVGKRLIVNKAVCLG
jgi:hypothetical protein